MAGDAAAHGTGSRCAVAGEACGDQPDDRGLRQVRLLPRLQTSRALNASVQDGLNLMTWGKDSFAYADSYDEAGNRYRGLVGGRMVNIGSGGLLVHPEAALQQMEAETPQPSAGAAAPDKAWEEPPEEPADVPPLKSARCAFMGALRWTRRA